MSKKILAMLMALAMIISMVPMSAMAEEVVHEHSYDIAQSNNNGTHKLYCICNAVLDFTLNCLDNDGDGKCDSCGYVKYVHKCDFEAGVTSNNDGTHKINCKCGEFVQVNCLDNDGDGKCDSCGYVKYVHKCDFEAGVTSNNDGTHKINCKCGEFVQVNCLDNDGDGKCDSCGHQKYPSHKCDFEAGVTSNKDGTHNVNCSCGKFVKVNCLDNDGDGKCDSCGYQKYIAPEGEHEHNYIAHSNNDGTHLLTCNCGKSVDFICLDSDGDGKCDSCGYQKYPTCDHKPGPWKSNDNGTHTSSCKCGKNTVTKACQFIGNKCHLCGYEKHVDHDRPQNDSKPVINYKDYDDVPKTGDILSMILAFFGF